MWLSNYIIEVLIAVIVIDTGYCESHEPCAIIHLNVECRRDLWESILKWL